MKLAEKILEMVESNVRYTVFKLAINNGLKDRQELNNLDELNTYLSKVSGNYVVIGTKGNGKSQAKLISVVKGERRGGQSPINKNQNTNIFNELKKMKFDVSEGFSFNDEAILKESKTQAALDKALASIEKQFGKGKDQQKPKDTVSNDNKLVYGPALKTWIFDYQDKGKTTLAKMMQRKYDKGEYTDKKPDRLVATNDSNRPEMLKNYISLYSKAKDKEIKSYLHDYLSEYNKIGYLDKLPSKTRNDIKDLWPKDIK